MFKKLKLPYISMLVTSQLYNSN